MKNLLSDEYSDLQKKKKYIYIYIHNSFKISK